MQLGDGKEAGDLIWPLPMRSEGLAFKCRALKHSNRVGHTPSCEASPEGQRREGITFLLSPQGTHLRLKQCWVRVGEAN